MIAHILTKNNQQTIQKTLESIRHCDQVLIADLGSNDLTLKIAAKYEAKIYRCPDMSRCEARNKLPHSKDWNVYIEPWEIMTQGHQPTLKGTACYGSVLQESTISKEIRYWKGVQKFVNPVYERLDAKAEHETNTVFYSTGRSDLDDIEIELDKWRMKSPTLAAPHYYKACLLLSKGRWEDFLQVSEHYMFLDRGRSMSSVMNHYYFAMGQLVHRRKVVPALQNINLCLCEKPLMAEFWCLLGDIYYHLLKKFYEAIEFYENAMILGSKRLTTDHWPMDISKYRKYPEKMIDSCQKIIKSQSFFGS